MVLFLASLLACLLAYFFSLLYVSESHKKSDLFAKASLIAHD